MGEAGPGLRVIDVQLAKVIEIADHRQERPVVAHLTPAKVFQFPKKPPDKG